MHSRRPADHRARAPRQSGPERFGPAIVVVALVLFTAVAYGPALQVPFIGDDYVFLDRTRSVSFGALWSFRNTDFGWYRPWSRELHFWTLQHLFGPHEPGFRAASLIVWLGALGAYFAVARRVAGERVAACAALGVATLSLWGSPLTWISGVQDLWMLLFSMLALLCMSRRREPLAWLAAAGALLSKETAVVLPLLVLAQARFAERAPWRTCARRATPFAMLSVAWAFIHPTLVERLLHPDAQLPKGVLPAPPLALVGRSLLSLVNADTWKVPVDEEALRPVATVFSTLLLGGAAAIVLLGVPRRRGPRPPAGGEPAAGESRAQAGPPREPSRGDLAKFGAAWCVAGWLPLLSRSIGWHAYYGSLGVLGAWLALAAVLTTRPRWAVALLVALGLLRGRAEATRSWDWGSQWYQTRAGNLLRLIRTQVHDLHPTLPPHSRLYFGNIPNNIGLVAGRSPALRVWYDDPTLEAGFYSYYRPRGPGEPAGPDLFFLFDSTSGIHEVSVDGGDLAGSHSPGSYWERDHEALAVTLLSAGDQVRAARLFEAIARLPNRADALMYAGACWRAHGDSALAAADFERARVRTGLTAGEIAHWADRLRETMPHHTPTVP